MTSNFSAINIQSSQSKLSNVQFKNLPSVVEVKEDHSQEGEDDSSDFPQRRPRASTFYVVDKPSRPLFTGKDNELVEAVEEEQKAEREPKHASAGDITNVTNINLENCEYK